MKFLIVFGTRPEAIKLAPLIQALRQSFSVCVCVTGQHRQMLDQVLDLFKIVPDHDLNLMTVNQGIDQLTANILQSLTPILKKESPDWLITQGDTTTTMVASLAAFYQQIPVAHVEAGLRTYNLKSPFPEELNRQLTSRMASLHFCPTASSRENLIKEGIASTQIHVTGNTVIDALYWVLKQDNLPPVRLPFDPKQQKTILVTGHRRENFGQGFEQICQALQSISQVRPDVQIVYPVHLNPNVQEPVKRILSGLKNVHLIEPLDYPQFVQLMNQSFLILTDSGGVQEEAPSLGKPVLVMRNTTERPEAVEGGTVRLVETNTEKIIEETLLLLDNPTIYQQMARAQNPYGDGKASERIVSIYQSLGKA